MGLFGGKDGDFSGLLDDPAVHDLDFDGKIDGFEAALGMDEEQREMRQILGKVQGSCLSDDFDEDGDDCDEDDDDFDDDGILKEGIKEELSSKYAELEMEEVADDDDDDSYDDDPVEGDDEEDAEDDDY